jgi:transglutaminase-like putative cysteine protease
VNAPQRYQVRHQTAYAYAGSVAHAHHLLHLTPRATATQHCHEHTLEIWPPPALRMEYVDAFGNQTTRLELDHTHERFEVTARMKVELLARPELQAATSLPWEQVRDGLRYTAAPMAEDWLDALRYRTQSAFVPVKRLFGAYAAECFGNGVPVMAGAMALMQKIRTEFSYVRGATHIGTSLLEVLEKRQGVCQDYAHFMIACLRSLGLPARYVSGYLHTGSGADAPRRLGADASHAWLAVFAPPLGWIELDPTNALVVDQEHVTLAWGRDFGDVSPLRGVILGGGAHSLEVGVDLRPWAN